jgi:hypothetical protein
MTTLNGGVYDLELDWTLDAGLLKNRNQSGKFVYDSGIDWISCQYFEMYLPVYSSNGWEMRQDNYNEKIRFIITLSPKILIYLIENGFNWMQ